MKIIIAKKASFALSLFWLAISCHSEAPHYALPVLDLSGVEAQVVQKIDSLQNIVIENPNSAEAWGKLGMNLYIHDLKEQSIVCFERAASLDTTVFLWPYLNAYTRSFLHLDGAPDWFARAMRLNDRYPPLYIRYGDALFKAGRSGEAETAYKKALDMNPRSSHVYLGLARVAFAKGELEKSMRYLEQALAINPRHGEVYGLLASVYRRMKFLEKSYNAMRMARALPADTKLGEAVITEVIREGVSSYWYVYRAREYKARARFYAAIEQYRQAAKYNSTADTFRELGDVHRILKKYQAAIAHYRKALALQPDGMATARALVAIYRETGENERAEYMESRISLFESGVITTFSERGKNEQF